MIVSEGTGTHKQSHTSTVSHTHPDIHLLLIKFQKTNTFGSSSKYLFEVMAGVCGLVRGSTSGSLSLCILRSSVSIWVSLKASTHIIHLSVIGTGNYVGQGINGLSSYAEFSLSDSNRSWEENHCEDPTGSGNIDILPLLPFWSLVCYFSFAFLLALWAVNQRKLLDNQRSQNEVQID